MASSVKHWLISLIMIESLCALILSMSQNRDSEIYFHREFKRSPGVDTGYDPGDVTTPTPTSTTEEAHRPFSKMNEQPWWQVWGKPYIKPEIGIFMTPQQTIFMPAATWTHLIDLDLPCLSDMITAEHGESWTKIVTTLTTMIYDTTQVQNVTLNKLTFEHMAYIIEIQKNLENFLSNIKSHISRIDTYDQYIYGIMDPICPKINLEIFRDDPDAYQKMETVLEGLKNSITETLDEGKGSKMKVPVFDVKMFDKPEILEKLKLLISSQVEQMSMKTGHARPNVGPPAVEVSTLSTVRTPQSTTPVAAKQQGKQDTDEFGDAHTLRKRALSKLPETYANHVTNQFINHGNFTNVVSGENGKANLLVPRQNPTQADGYKTPDAYTSQFFQVESGVIKAAEVPVISNYMTSIAPTTTQPFENTTEEPIGHYYPYLNPRESFVNNARKVLSKAPMIDLNDNGDKLGIEVRRYYATVMKDIRRISTEEPFPIELDQKGVMTLKVCYSWRNSQDDLRQRCSDRYLPNIKKWEGSCHGISAESLLPQKDAGDNSMLYVPDSERFSKDLLTFKIKYTDNSLFKVLDNEPTLVTRRRRGIGDDIMKTFWKPMFGAASENDLSKIKVFLEETNKAQRTMAENQKLLMSYTKGNNEKVDIVTKAIEETSKALNNQLESQASDLSKLSRDLKAIAKKVSRNEVLSSLLSMQMYVHNALTLLKFKLNEITETYKTLDHMVRRKVLLPSILSVDTLGDIIQHLSISNHKKWEVAPTWRFLSHMDDKSASMMIKDRHVLVIIKVPLVQKTIDYTVYYSQSIPFLIGDTIVEAQHAGSYYLLDRTNKVWSKITPRDYLECLNNPGHICPYNHPQVSLPLVDCYVSIVAGSDLAKPNKLCNIQVSSNSSSNHNQIQPFVGIPLSHNQWIVSVLNKTGVYAYELCDETQDTLAAQTSQKLLSDINVILVSDGCRVQIGSTTFTNTRNWRTNNYHSMTFSNTQLISTEGLAEIRIWRMQSIIPQTLKNATILSFKPQDSKRKKTYLFKKGQTSVEEILKALDNAKANTSTLGLMEPDIPEIPNFDYQEPSSWSISHWQIWSMILGSMPVIFGLSLVALLIVKFIFKSRASAATVAFSALPTSFAKAAEIVTKAPTISDIANNFQLIRKQMESNNNFTASINGTLDHLIQNTTIKPHWSMWVMLIIMIVMLILHVLHSFEMLTHRGLIRNIMRSSCSYPKNRAVTMHNIEEPVILVFLIKVFKYGNAEPINTTMALQVATLPSPYDQWTVQSRSYRGSFSSLTTVYRSSANLIIALNWTHICIQSRLKANLDTCEDMPKECIIPVKELDMAIDGGLPWNWSMIQQERILKIEVGRIGAMKMIFQYDIDEEDNTVTVPLLNY